MRQDGEVRRVLRQEVQRKAFFEEDPHALAHASTDIKADACADSGTDWGTDVSPHARANASSYLTADASSYQDTAVTHTNTDLSRWRVPRVPNACAATHSRPKPSSHFKADAVTYEEFLQKISNAISSHADLFIIHGYASA